MATNNDKIPTILVPVNRGKGGQVDVDRFVKDAEAEVRKYAEEDQAATKAVTQVTDKILTDERHKDMTQVTSSVLARMALAALGEVPTDKLCAEAAIRVESYLKARPEEFLHVERGRDAGFHIRARLTKERLEALEKAKAKSTEKAAAE